MTDTPLIVNHDGPVATLTLNRPDRRNALSDDLIRALTESVEALASPDSGVRCLLLTGAGRGFSSGADLVDGGRNGVPDLHQTLTEGYNPLIRRLHAFPAPVVAAVNGPAVGAGMSLALTADFIIAARSAYFMQAFVNIGLAPDAGSTWYLPRLIGPARAARMTMLGERIDAGTAAEWGLIHSVVDDNQLMDEANTLAQSLAEGPTLALSGIRALLRDSLQQSFSDQLDAEAELQGRLGRTQDFLAGVSAFIGKTKAKFSGR